MFNKKEQAWMARAEATHEQRRAMRRIVERLLLNMSQVSAANLIGIPAPYVSLAASSPDKVPSKTVLLVLEFAEGRRLP